MQSSKKAKESSELQRYRGKRIKRQASKNDRPDESLTGQAHDQAGHCPLTGRYFDPCLAVMISHSAEHFHLYV